MDLDHWKNTNSFRYSDYCFGKFMEAASKEEYFHNTIFVFYRRSRRSGHAREMYPAAWTDQRLTDEHVPLLFYAPYLLKPQARKRSSVTDRCVAHYSRHDTTALYKYNAGP
jgi:phosphoglycerol transferase MdoB-like AlkP superfamily enzyme